LAKREQSEHLHTSDACIEVVMKELRIGRGHDTGALSPPRRAPIK
jgi:hypothetical protein